MVVLCIDNDPEDIEFFCDAIKVVDSSIVALAALSGQEALNLLNSLDPAELPAYIFLDINMPKMNGKETLQAIRKIKQCKGAQIVMLSTGLDPNDSMELKDLGATHFMAKANSLQSLCDGLSKVLK